jgi:hypothetical protein
MKLLIALLFSLPISSWAFTLCTTNPGQGGWGNKTVTLKLNSANCPSNIAAIVGDAMSVWNSITTTR